MQNVQEAILRKTSWKYLADAVNVCTSLSLNTGALKLPRDCVGLVALVDKLRK